MHHKEQVRIAVSKALARVLTTLTSLSAITAFPQTYLLLEALIILLNDEQPDIRYYLCEAGEAALSDLVDHQRSGRWLIMKQQPVKLNDQIVVELIFEDFTQRLLNAGDE